jgi:hypothetical protein
VLLERRDRLGHARQDGVAVARVSDRRLEHVSKGSGAELEQHPEPGVDRSRNARCEQARPGDEVECELAEALGRRGRRRRTLPAHDEHIVAFGRVEKNRQVPARPVEVRLDDLEHEPGRCGRVERVASCLEEPHPSRGREPVRRRDHPEGAVELGAGGEHARHFTSGV